ncbi:MAG TPA: IS1595 family transposase [Oculatellaceae cyanobacterium]
MNFFEFLKKFPTEEAVITNFIRVRYGERPACHHCGSIKVHQKKDRPKVFHCADCLNTFSVFKGTIFENSSTDLRKWMYAIHLFLNSKKGISSYQLEREIGVTHKTAWRMLGQIRSAMGNAENQEFIDTVIEIDETYVGGNPRKGQDDDDDKPKRGRGTKKTPVVGVVDRDNKKIHAKIAKPNKEGKKLTGKQLLEIINEVVKNPCLMITDEFKGYNSLRHSQHLHLRINHQEAFAQGIVHTNNIESFWATLKRGLIGIYHHVSVKHLQDYVNEFCFRYNHRENNGMFDLVLKQAVFCS